MLTIRKAQPTDLQSITALSEIWEAEEITYGLIANTINDLTAFLEDGLWVAIYNDRVTGYLLGEIKHNPGLSVFNETIHSYFEIMEIYVHPDFRGRGFGYALLKETIADLNRQGISRMTVSTANKDWQSVLGFYEKSGFKTWTMTLFK